MSSIERALHGELIPLLPKTRPLPDPIYAVYPAIRHVPAKVRLAIGHLVTACAQDTADTRLEQAAPPPARAYQMCLSDTGGLR